MEKMTIAEMVKEQVAALLAKLQAEKEKHPLRMAEQFGVLCYIRLFVESQAKTELQSCFPFAGFPMEWPADIRNQEEEQVVWQFRYPAQYCASVVEPGHFMEKISLTDNGHWIREMCACIDWICERCDWTEGMPVLFGQFLEEMIQQIYELGNSGLFLLPDAVTDIVTGVLPAEGSYKVWNPSCRTGGLLGALYRHAAGVNESGKNRKGKETRWEIKGTESVTDWYLIAQMQQFFRGQDMYAVHCQDSLELSPDEKFDLIVSNPPVGELPEAQQGRFPVATRKIQLQYLQAMMEHLQENGMAVAIVNEGTLFMYDAEKKVRQRIVEEFDLQGVISLPAGALLPYTAGKPSILLFLNRPSDQPSGHAQMQPSSMRTQHDHVWFFEIKHIGYSLDRRQKDTEENDVPRFLEFWNQVSEKEILWERQKEAGIIKNQWGIPVPANWTEEHYWFADKDTIRRNDYNLTSGRYQPQAPTEEKTSESPLAMLLELERLEQESQMKIRELIEMVKRD